jgi:hypothetical protein
MLIRVSHTLLQILNVKQKDIPKKEINNMSWYKTLGKGLVTGARVATQVGIPIATAFGVPGLGLIAAASNGILRAETAFTESGKGKEKSELVVGEFEAGLQTTQEILATQNKQLVYDKAALQEFIDAQVAAYKAMAKVKESFKITDIEEKSNG